MEGQRWGRRRRLRASELMRGSERASTGERARASEHGLQKVVAQAFYNRAVWRVVGEG